MRVLRSLLVACVLPLVTVGISDACGVKAAMVSGKFTKAGQFEIVSALDSKGNPLENLKGKVFPNVITAEDMTLATADYTDQVLYVVADLDFDRNAMHVSSYTACAQTAAACVESARAGAKLAGAPGCGSKAATANVSNASGCGSKAASVDAKVAGASNASGCGSKAATANVSNAAGCCPSAAKSAEPTAAPKSSDESAGMIVFSVSGMTCGSCVDKIQSAVAALAMDGVQSCTVSLENGQAVIQTSGEVCKKTLQKAIVDAGFPADLQTDEEAPATM